MPERVIFHHALDEEACERCGTYGHLRVKLLPLRPGTDLVLCVLCLGDAIEHITHWKMHNLLTQWLAADAVARIIREEREQDGR